MTKYRIMYWRDIPTLITARDETHEVKRPMPRRFGGAISAYATRAGLTSTSDFAAQYHKGEWIERDGSPEEVADAVVRELDEQFKKFDLPPKPEK